MNAKNTRIEIQKLLFPGQEKEHDGYFGPKTEKALVQLKAAKVTDPWPKTQALEGRVLKAPGFAFEVIVSGEDLLIKNCRATCFGGSNDPQDSGETASGISTKANPGIKACSLPMNYTGSHGPTRKVLAGSPIPMLPWKTPVEVTALGETHTYPVIDLGPANYTGNALDLTVAAARDFKPNASATNFEMRCDVRIIGGARYL